MFSFSLSAKHTGPREKKKKMKIKKDFGWGTLICYCVYFENKSLFIYLFVTFLAEHSEKLKFPIWCFSSSSFFDDSLPHDSSVDRAPGFRCPEAYPEGLQTLGRPQAGAGKSVRGKEHQRGAVMGSPLFPSHHTTHTCGCLMASQV